MVNRAKKQLYTKIPVKVTQNEFNEFFLEHLSQPKRGPKCKLGYFKILNYIFKVLYTGMQWKELVIDVDDDCNPEIHYTSIYKVYARWSEDGSIQKGFIASVKKLSVEDELDISILNGDGTNTVAKKGGDGIGYSGHKHQKGEKVLAIVDKNGYVISPFTIAPVNHNDCILLPESLGHLSSIVREIGLSIKNSILNLDGVFDSKKNRKDIFNRGMIPNIPENKRNRKKTKRGRKRLFNEDIHKLRLAVERTFAWEDKFKRLLLRFERKQSRHLSFKVLAYTMINLRPFCQVRHKKLFILTIFQNKHPKCARFFDYFANFTNLLVQI